MSAAQRLRLTGLQTIDVIVCVLLTLLAGVPGLLLALLLVLIKPGWVISNLVLTLVLPFVAGPSGLLLAAFIALVGFGRVIPSEPRTKARPRRSFPSTGDSASSGGDTGKTRNLRTRHKLVSRDTFRPSNQHLFDRVCDDPNPWNPMSIYINDD